MPLRDAWAGVLAAVMCFSGNATLAETPLSAIDWLSDSIAAPQPMPAAPEPEETRAPQNIIVSTLDPPNADAAGLLPPSITGLPRALWGPSTTDDVLARLAAVPTGLPPSLSELLTTILLAEANAPVGPTGDDRLLLARVDRLLAMGALDQAGALLERAGVDTPDRFRRVFDIALLQGTETEACLRMRDRPEFSPTYPARIFCLARGGDWQAAALTLETAETLGILTPAEDLLLARFLDDEIVGDAGVAWRNPTPLTFRMLEAIGEPAPTGPLAVAFAWADLRPTRGWKAQIEAAERLARGGVLSGNQLFGLYQRQRPSASGGVWERAKVVQDLQAALSDGDAEALERVLPRAWDRMQESGLTDAFAKHYGAELAALPLDGDAARLARRVGLLSSAYETVALRADAGDEDRFLTALARGLPETSVARTSLELAVRDGFTMDGPPETLARHVAEGRIGEAILKAITLFAEGAEGDPDGISDAVALFRVLGLESVARQASIELLLRESSA